MYRNKKAKIIIYIIIIRHHKDTDSESRVENAKRGGSDERDRCFT